MNITRIVASTILLACIALAYNWYFTSKSPSTGLPIVEVNIPELTQEAKSGEAAFKEHCAVCHGENAAGQDGVAPPLVHIIYEPSHHGDQSFYIAAQNGVRQHHWPFGNMPPIEGITDAQMTNVISYIRELQRANGIN